jgi:hypothetical protein
LSTINAARSLSARYRPCSAVLEVVGKKVRVALVGREKETVSEFLLRLDAALGQALQGDIVIDEVLREMQSRHPR